MNLDSFLEIKNCVKTRKSSPGAGIVMNNDPKIPIG